MISGNCLELAAKYKIPVNTIRGFVKKLGITKIYPNPLTVAIFYYDIDEHNDKFIRDYVKSEQYKLRSKLAKKANKTTAKNRLKQKQKAK